MAVSANTLFHFTKINGLRGILSAQGFYCQYSDEHFENILPQKNPFCRAYIPMISFCDLTITQVSNDSLHREHFGSYGIGLTKEWGITKRVSPVIYVHKRSQPARQLHELSRMLKNLKKKVRGNFPFLDVEEKLIDSFKYIKPYKGRWHKGKKIKDGRKPIMYYNEREWRYCPQINEHSVLSAMIKDNKKERKKLNNDLKKEFIKFTPEDIKFIIIRNKKDINDIARVIHNMGIKPSQKNELLAKIRTFQEIKEDY